MHRLTQTSLRLVALMTLVLTACGEDGIANLKAKLVVQEGTPKDEQGRYLLEFGEIGIGFQGRRSLVVKNEGRAALNIEQPEVAPPFSLELTSIPSISVAQNRELGFLFKPADEGAAEVVVQLRSNGGEATVVLRARGVKPPPTEDTCTYQLRPNTLDFGNIQKGMSKSLGTRVDNTGVGAMKRCEVADVRLSPDTDPSFQLIGSAITSEVLEGGDAMPVGVSFTPSRTGFSFLGKLLMQIGPPGKPGAVVEVPLKGQSVEPCANPNPDGSCPVATAPIYLNEPSALYTFDMATKKATHIGNFRSGALPLSNMFDIGIDNNGLLVGIDSGVLYTINPTNAAVQRFATSSQTGANGLTFIPDGRVVIAGSRVEIYDRTTRQFTTLVPDGRYSTAGDIVGLPDGLLYWAVNGSGSTNRLVTVNPANGQTNDLGDIGVGSIWGMSYADGKLIGFTSTGQVFEIDPHTAKAGPRSNVAGNWYGAATNPTKW